MIRRVLGACAPLAFVLAAHAAHAQGASIAVGASMPSGDLSTTTSAGYNIELQILTERMVGPLKLRIDIGYDHLSGKDGAQPFQLSSQAVSLAGEFNSTFYWIIGPGYYQTQQKSEIAGHTVNSQRSMLGAQAAVGMNFRITRFDAFLEAGAVKLFNGSLNQMYVPLRFGFRL